MRGPPCLWKTKLTTPLPHLVGSRSPSCYWERTYIYIFTVYLFYIHIYTYTHTHIFIYIYTTGPGVVSMDLDYSYSCTDTNTLREHPFWRYWDQKTNSQSEPTLISEKKMPIFGAILLLSRNWSSRPLRPSSPQTFFVLGSPSVVATAMVRTHNFAYVVVLKPYLWSWLNDWHHGKSYCVMK